MHQMRRITLLSSVSSLHLLLKVFCVSAITAKSRCQGRSQGWEQRWRWGGETGKVLPGERRVIMSTMASLINDEDSTQSGQLSAENWRSYIFHCSVPHEVSVLCSCEHTRKWICGAGYWHRPVAGVISSQSSSNVTNESHLVIIMLVTGHSNLSQLKHFACSGLPHLMSLGPCHVCHAWHVTR